ncbi:hypothetical protein [Rhizobium sp. AAP43]|uniref:DUF6950 family protein n=1 Tax=Rhizobium sp. AAP43 TaxID=1523420 RepID=UPI0006B96A2B|nr:hypothetical protein [Rhizobium sp. AAP43]KPF47063.1 hypothetical protein IP76_01815 [Rhizobium sp. AAP43]
MIEDNLAAYLDAAIDQPMIWGESDCTTWPARWIERVRSCPLDMPRWSSRGEAYSLIDVSGSLLALWDDVLGRAGLFETGSPLAGDVGVITSHAHGQCGGIFLANGFFAWRAEPQGYRILRPRADAILKAWSIR